MYKLPETLKIIRNTIQKTNISLFLTNSNLQNPFWITLLMVYTTLISLNIKTNKCFNAGAD